MTKQTPGEWFIEKELPTEHPGIEANVFGKFFSVVIWGNSKDTNDDSGVRGRTPEEAMANARLIAAAPDLLEALEFYALSYTDEELFQLAESTSGMGEICPTTAKREIIRRAAIAKAKGEP